MNPDTLRTVAATQTLAEPDRAAFARDFEFVLTNADAVAEHLAALDDLSAPDAEAALFDDAEIERFAAQGLSWIPAPRLALFALDRGAVVGLHELVYEVWSDYWQRRVEEAETRRGTWAAPEVRAARLRSALASQFVELPPPAATQTVRGEPAMAFNAASPFAVTPTITVPAEQTAWAVGEPRAIRVSLKWPPEVGELEAKAAGLPVVTGATVELWLADAALVVVATATGAVVAVPPDAQPKYLVGAYRSASADVVYAAALDGTPLPPDVFARLRSLAGS
jgi:hypothetical protein